MWSDYLLKWGMLGQFLPAQSGSFEVNGLVFVKPLGSKNKDYALNKNKTRRFLEGWKYYLEKHPNLSASNSLCFRATLKKSQPYTFKNTLQELISS